MQQENFLPPKQALFKYAHVPTIKRHITAIEYYEYAKANVKKNVAEFVKYLALAYIMERDAFAATKEELAIVQKYVQNHDGFFCNILNYFSTKQPHYFMTAYREAYLDETLKPYVPRLTLMLAMIFCAMSSYEKAINVLETNAAILDYNAQYILGVAKSNLERFNDAQHHFELYLKDAHAQDEKVPDAWYQLALLSASKNPEKTRQYLQRATEADEHRIPLLSASSSGLATKMRNLMSMIHSDKLPKPTPNPKLNTSTPVPPSESESESKYTVQDIIGHITEAKKKFESNDFTAALYEYTQALRILDELPRTSDRDKHRALVYSGRAASFIKIAKYKEAYVDCLACCKVVHYPKIYIRKVIAMKKLFLMNDPEICKNGIQANACVALHFNADAMKNEEFATCTTDLNLKYVVATEDLTSILSTLVASITVIVTRPCIGIPVLISRSVSIIGAGDIPCTILNSGLIITGTDVYVENLRVNSNLPTPIRVEGGKCKMVNCSIEHKADFVPALSCCANMEMYHCNITRSSGGGILVYDTGKLLAGNLDISKCAASAVEARQGGQVTVQDCELYECNKACLLWTKPGNCVISRNKIYAMNDEGILVNGETKKIMITSNHVHHCSYGISCQTGCTITLSANVVDKCQFHGITVQDEVSGQIVSNRLSRNGCGGLYIGGNFAAQLLVENNTFQENRAAGITNMPEAVQSQDFKDPLKKMAKAALKAKELSKNVTIKNNKDSENYSVDDYIKRTKIIESAVEGKGDQDALNKQIFPCT